MIPFSIVIPTYKEVNNIDCLLKTIQAASFSGRPFEVILVDDNSQDGSLELMQQLQTNYPWARMIVREGPRSLSRAVMLGCEQAHHPHLVCMDADLSHPVDVIPSLLTCLEQDQTEMVIGSRYVSGGSVDERWPEGRKWISKTCAFLTKWMLNLSVSDPLSGFFAIKKSTLQRGSIKNPSGWKIALEILIKCRCQHVKEVPILFSDRRFGKSKLNARVGMAFIKQISQLAYFQYIG